MDDQQGRAAVGEAANRLADCLRALIVEVGGRLVEQKQRAVGEKRPGERDALSLAG